MFFKVVFFSKNDTTFFFSQEQKKIMYRWARTAWNSINQHEKQSLLRHQTAAHQRFFDYIFDGRPVPLEKYTPAITTPVHLLALNEWKHQLRHLNGTTDNDVHRYACREGLFGLEIPSSYGGRQCPPIVHSRLLQFLASADRQGNWLHRIMVPNSLGPAQLLLKYGTEEQKNYYLPKLVSGQLIPCFGLTGPWNGSDAGGSLPDKGIFEKDENGINGIRFSCEKRWITLSPIADVLGIAVKTDKGITLVIVDKTRLSPHDVKKIMIQRHLPIGSAFPNGSIRIDNLWLPISDSVIGGSDGVGQGWNMLMECLDHGRGISLPSGSLGSMKHLVWHCTFYALVREQFKTPLLLIPTVQSMLAQIVLRCSLSHIMNEFYHAMLHSGETSASVSAMMKYVLTTWNRETVLLAMDIFAGKGITLGSKNPIVGHYLQNPISITVEGSNPLTKHVIIPIQVLFDHHTRFKQLSGSLEYQKPVDFYFQSLQAGIDIVKAVLTRLPVIDTLVSQRSRCVLESYRLLLQGKQLRANQKLCGEFTDQLLYTFILHAIKWAQLHTPLCSSSSVYKDFLYQYFVLKRTYPVLDQHTAKTISQSLLYESDVLSMVEQDICLVPNEPLYRVRRLWTSDYTIEQFHREKLTKDLKRQVIDVDEYPL